MKKIILFLFIFSVVKLTFCQWTNLNSGTNQFLLSIQFVNDSTGYCSSDNGTILKTTNGYNNWNMVGNCAAKKLQFVNVDTGFAYGLNDILKSTDSGVNWTSKLSSINGFPVMHFPTTSTGYTSTQNIGLDSLYVYKTIDSGENWNIISVIPDSNSAGILSIFFLNANTGLLSNISYGRLYRTTDGGINWNLVFTSASAVWDIFFPSSSIGYAVGFDSYLKTIDGGLNWTEMTLPFSGLFYALSCPSINNCHIVGGDGFGTGTLIKTINAGTNWTQSGVTTTTYTDVYFLNDSTGYACGANGSIIKYGSSGLSNQEQSIEFLKLYPNPAKEFISLSFDNPNKENFKALIYNSHGEVVNEINNINANTVQIDLKNMAPGLYNVQLYSQHQKFKSCKLIVE